MHPTSIIEAGNPSYYSSNTAVMSYQLRMTLKRNRSAILRLFEGRHVQPINYVIQQVASFMKQSPLSNLETVLLSEILDPNKTGYVTVKRLRDLVRTSDESEAGDHPEEVGSALITVSSNKHLQLHRQSNGRWVPPKRAPPMANASLYAASTALSLVPNAKTTRDPDMLAIMTAIQWSGRHLSQPSSIDRRFLASTPISRYAVPVPAQIIPSVRTDVAFPLISDALKRISSDEDRGWAVAALVATHVRSEIVFREMIRAEVPEILVPEDILQAFLASPRWYRQQILDSTKSDEPHVLFRSLSAVRLPLVVTTLRVEMDSSSRKVMNAFLPMDVGGAWARSTEKERCACVTALLDLNMWDEDFVPSLGGNGFENILLMRHLMALPQHASTTYVPSKEEEEFIRSAVEKLKEKMERITEMARAPIRPPLPLENDDSRESLENGDHYDLANSQDEDDLAIVRLQMTIANLHEELLL